MNFIFTTRILILSLLFTTSVEAQLFLKDSAYGINGIARLQSNYSGTLANYSSWGDGFRWLVNGKTIALHSTYIGTNLTVAQGLIQFTADGKKIDSSFGTNGTSQRVFSPLSNVSANYNIPICTAVDDEGNIFIGGRKKFEVPPFAYINTLIKFLPDGKVDSSFATDGVFYYNPSPGGGGLASIINIFPINDNKLILFSQSNSGESNECIYLKGSGIIDSSFGINGFQKFSEFNVSGERHFYNSPAIMSDGGLIIGCANVDSTTWINKSKFLIKVKPNGYIDSSFGIFGKKIIDSLLPIQNFQLIQQHKTAILQADGKIITLMLSTNNNTKSLVRFHANGNTDSSFGTNGVLDLQFSQTSNYNFFKVNDFEIIGNSHIVIVGYTCDTNTSGTSCDALVRLYQINGTIETTFGNNGTEYIEGGANTNDNLLHIGVKDSNNFMVAGGSNPQEYLMIKFYRNANFPTLIEPIFISSNTIFPNPNNGNFSISNSETFNNASIKIFSLTGQLMFEQNNNHSKEINVQMNAFAKGIYFVEVSEGNKKSRFKVLCE